LTTITIPVASPAGQPEEKRRDRSIDFAWPLDELHVNEYGREEQHFAVLSVHHFKGPGRLTASVGQRTREKHDTGYTESYKLFDSTRVGEQRSCPRFSAGALVDYSQLVLRELRRQFDAGNEQVVRHFTIEGEAA
jgi:hypothetical protein